ncbi:unnamed protein product [Microthlaspi erraticum]|uniref:Uncharacterized protein n=1 Tax=Microthlaspi erraticum TaxID=1685480 RepID=A0A6D2IUW8_9BRAS|nr:unnamed protein product [Microthlaspi erraticum]
MRLHWLLLDTKCRFVSSTCHRPNLHLTHVHFYEAVFPFQKKTLTPSANPHLRSENSSSPPVSTILLPSTRPPPASAIAPSPAPGFTDPHHIVPSALLLPDSDSGAHTVECSTPPDSIGSSLPSTQSHHLAHKAHNAEAQSSSTLSPYTQPRNTTSPLFFFYGPY